MPCFPENVGSGSANLALVAATPAQLIAFNLDRQGLNIENDSAATAPVYLLLGAGTPSATNWHFALPAGVAWNGLIGYGSWRGAVQAVCSANTRVGVVEVY